MKNTFVINHLVDFLSFIELSEKEKAKYSAVLISTDVSANEFIRFDGEVIINDRAIVELKKIECKKLTVWGVLWAENIRAEEIEIQSKLHTNEMKTNSLVIYNSNSFYIATLKAKEVKTESEFEAKTFKSSFQK